MVDPIGNRYYYGYMNAYKYYTTLHTDTPCKKNYSVSLPA